MKGFAMLDFGKVGWIEKDRPVPGPYDAIVKPLAVAPCTSDVHTVYEAAFPKEMMEFPRIIGHEAAGEVVEVGDKVRDFKYGDKVVVPAITPEWRTKEVQLGIHQHSGGLLAGWKFSNPLRDRGKDGVFAEYFHVNDADMNLAHLPDDIKLEAAVMAADMMTTGFHGAELADIRIGETVVVIGIGPVGLMAVAGAKLRGAGRIIAVGGRRKITYDLAREYGASDIVDYTKGPIETQVLELTGGEKVDKVIIAGGGPDIIYEAVKIVRPGGIIANAHYFGSGADVYIKNELKHRDVLYLGRVEWGAGMSHIKIVGGLCPGGRVRMERLLSIIRYKRVDPSKLVTHRFRGLEKVEDAFYLMREKPLKLVKPVVFME